MLPKGAPSPYTQRDNLQLCSQSRSLLICFEAVVARVWRSVKASLLAILHRCGLEPGVYLSSGPNSSATTAAIFRCTAWFFLSFCMFLRLHDCVHVLCTSSLLRAQQFLVRRLRTRLAIVAIQGVLFAAEESPFALLAERNCSYLYRVDLSIFVRAFLFFEKRKK